MKNRLWTNSKKEVNYSFSNSILLNVFRHLIFTASEQSCGKVMFSLMCICHSICPRDGRGGVFPRDHY